MLYTFHRFLAYLQQYKRSNREAHIGTLAPLVEIASGDTEVSTGEVTLLHRTSSTQ